MENLKNPHFPAKIKLYLTDIQFSMFQCIGPTGLVNQQGIERILQDFILLNVI